MVKLDFTASELQSEIDRILKFITEQVGPYGKVLLGVSGGIDSDVTARLCARVVEPERMKCFTVLQDNFEQKYIHNVRQLTADIKCQLVEIPLAPVPKELITIMSEADPSIGFRPNGLLDVARSKCAIRTFIFSAYSERGYLVAGPSNRTEIELGYYLPFGDGLSHFSSIAHLYKTQIRQLAQVLGTREPVMEQQPSAGFWEGDSDLEGIAFWLFNGAPIQVEGDWNEAQLESIFAIHRELTFRAIDTALAMFNDGNTIEAISQESGLSRETVERLAQLRDKARVIKNRKLSVRLA